MTIAARDEQHNGRAMGQFTVGDLCSSPGYHVLTTTGSLRDDQILYLSVVTSGERWTSLWIVLTSTSAIGAGWTCQFGDQAGKHIRDCYRECIGTPPDLTHAMSVDFRD